MNGTRFTMGNYQQASSPYASMPSLYISGAGTPPIVVQPPLLLFAARLPETMLAVVPPLALATATHFDVGGP